MMRCKAYVGSENSNGHHSMYPTNLKLKEPRILPKDISRDIIRQIEGLKKLLQDLLDKNK